MTITQRINNWIYGENSRESNRFHHYSNKATVERFAILAQVLPDGTKVFGIDISHWNAPGTINFQQLKDEYNLQFVILKGCDGSVNSNYYFENLSAVKAAGLLWGMYCWLYPASKVNIDAQVNAWHTRAQLDPPPMGIFIDCEWTYYGGAPANPGANDLRSAHDKLRALQGKSAITYTAKGYADSYLKGFDWWREELWIANYNVPYPAMPNGSVGYTFWQFTSTFMFNGKNYDGNYFNGTQAEFTERYGGTVTPPPPNGGTMEQWKSLVEGLAVRSGANPANPPAYTKVQDLKKNDIVDGVLDVAKNWIRIYKITRALTGTVLIPTTGEWWCSGLPAYVEKVIVVPPPVVDAVTLDIVLHDVKVVGDKYEVLGVKAIKTA